MEGAPSAGSEPHLAQVWQATRRLRVTISMLTISMLTSGSRSSRADISTGHARATSLRSQRSR